VIREERERERERGREGGATCWVVGRSSSRKREGGLSNQFEFLGKERKGGKEGRRILVVVVVVAVVVVEVGGRW